MADLFDRLFGTGEGEGDVPVHGFAAALIDYAAGETSRAQIVGYWGLDASAEADLDVLCDAIDGMAAAARVQFCVEFHAVAMIAEIGVKYETKGTFAARLGLV
jgi:hypothetical protein